MEFILFTSVEGSDKNFCRLIASNWASTPAAKQPKTSSMSLYDFVCSTADDIEK